MKMEIVNKRALEDLNIGFHNPEADINITRLYRDTCEAWLDMKVKLKPGCNGVTFTPHKLTLTYAEVGFTDDPTRLNIEIKLSADNDAMIENWLSEALGLRKIDHYTSLHIHGDYLEHYTYEDSYGNKDKA